MSFLSIILVSVISLFVFSFPLLCAILLRFFCKMVSDRFIIHFLGIVCSLPIAVSSFIQADEIHARMGMEETSSMFSLVMVPLMTFFFSYCVCQTLAHAGVVVAEKGMKKGKEEKKRGQASVSGNHYRHAIKFRE